MKILFDQGVPKPLRRYLAGHEITTASQAGFSLLSNGDLVSSAEASYQLLITTDKNLRYQQNISQRKIAILVLSCAHWPTLEQRVEEIQQALPLCRPGCFIELCVHRHLQSTMRAAGERV